MENYRTILDEQQAQRETAAFMSRVYAWMSLALVITALVSLVTASTPAIFQVIFGNRLIFYGLLIGEIALVVWLSAAIGRMSASQATLLYLGYSALNGLTLSVIFLVYTAGSIFSTFLITAGTFAAMSLYGYFTKRDLTSLGNLLLMALIGLIIASVVNIFWQNSTFYWITTYAGVLIFTGLVAYDTQKIKNMNELGNEGTEEDRKEAIMGALALYLDFINLFLYLLRLFGSRRN
ncbi:MAG TPA: Bax inhibitor-1/YccA family protein [Saprospiraceae bacterium]|nr:Bax inhibitor-1/YccA family protein [Saprospiraceae bacterium]HNM26162.1 Bax inhibitor-1/YccA family protein [Saprospiraceae bacterium]